jgi:hypothetical protein
VSTIQEIEAAIPRLSRVEVEQLRNWIDDYLEETFELTDEVKAKLDQSRREMAEGRFTSPNDERTCLELKAIADISNINFTHDCDRPDSRSPRQAIPLG